MAGSAPYYAGVFAGGFLSVWILHGAVMLMKQEFDMDHGEIALYAFGGGLGSALGLFLVHKHPVY